MGLMFELTMFLTFQSACLDSQLVESKVVFTQIFLSIPNNRTDLMPTNIFEWENVFGAL